VKIWELSQIISYLSYESADIKHVLDECEDYELFQDDWKDSLKKLERYKKNLFKYREFRENQRKGKRKGNRFSWLGNIKLYWDAGNINAAKLQMSAAFTDFRVFHSKQTLWRFQNDLKKLGISEKIIQECKEY